jgi:hypothetical protein
MGATASSYFGFDEGMARTLKQQNDLILQRCVRDAPVGWPCAFFFLNK